MGPVAVPMGPVAVPVVGWSHLVPEQAIKLMEGVQTCLRFLLPADFQALHVRGWRG